MAAEKKMRGGAIMAEVQEEQERRATLRNIKNPDLDIRIFPGHFATEHSHVNFYVDLDSVKSNAHLAREAAKIVAEPYMLTPVDTIVCLQGTQVLGAYVAERLMIENDRALNFGKHILVVSPEVDRGGQLIFRDNRQYAIKDKQILLIVSSTSTGKSISQLALCLGYYGGKLAGVTSLFSAADEVGGVKVNSLFRADSVRGYGSFETGSCPLCSAGVPLDAIVNENGYSKLGS